MNARSYKTVFSKRLGALVAVGEHASSQGKANGAGAGGGASGTLGYVAALSASFAFVSLAWAAPVTNELPTFGQVVQGAASMSQTANQMTINQSTQRAIINWQSFNIGAGARVQVNQLNSQAVLLNRVVGQSPSQIFGQLQANGHVILVNPNGVLFGKDGSVNAAAFTASTLGISDANFMAGNMLYERNGSTAGIVNEGTITTAPGGYVALLGASVSNEGKIETKGGNVFLAAADTIKVPVSGTGRIKLELSAADMNANVSNSGSIITEGGQVYMQALALNRAAAQIIQSGSIDTSGNQGGAVHLLVDGGKIRVNGSIKANSTGIDENGQAKAGGDIYIGRDKDTNVLAAVGDVSGARLESVGGFVETSGQFLAAYSTRVTAKDWLLDPTDITIAASGASGDTYNSNFTAGTTSVILASDIVASLNGGTNVSIATSSSGSDAGNITLSSAISKTAGVAANLTLSAHNNIFLNAGISSTSGALGVTLNAGGTGGTGGISGDSSGTINTNGGLLTLNTSNAAATGTLAGVISGTGALTKTGAGTTTLSAANTYTGATTVSGGTLVFQNTNASTSYNTASGAVTEFNVASGTRDLPTASFSGTGTLRKTGAGTLQWGVSAGTFAMGSGGLIDIQAGTFVGGSNANETWTNNLASLNVASGAVFDGVESAVRVDGLTGLGTVKSGYTGYPGNITVGVANANATFAGVLANSVAAGSFVKAGTGTQILTGVNTYTGSTTINGGTLEIGNGTSGTIGSGAIVIDGANTALNFKNAGSTQVTLNQTVTGNGNISADKAIAFAGVITINKSATDNNNSLTIKTTGADNTNIGLGRSINLNNSILQASGAGDVKLVVDSYSSLYANGTGVIGATTAGLGKLDVEMTSRGKDQAGNTSSAYSLGMSLAKAINANGGSVTLTANQGNTNAGSGGAGGALIFGNGSGITAASFTATGTYTAGNNGGARAGITTNGTTNFAITGTGTGKFVGTSNSNDTPWSQGIYTSGTVNLNSGTGQIKMEGGSTRSEANVNTNSSGTGSVTLGVSTGGWFQRSGTVTAQTGKLNIIGTTVQTYNGQAAIKGSNGTTINMMAPSIVLGSVPVNSEGAPTIGLATGATGYTLNINADNLNIRTGTITATTNVGTGTVTIKNFTSGTKIDIGGSDVAAVGATPATLGLTNAELNTITTAKLVIGSSTAGDVTVSSAVTTNTSSGNVKLITGGNIAVNAALTVGNGNGVAAIAGDKNLTLSAEGTNSQITGAAVGVIKANQLLLSGSTATVALAAAAHQVKTLAASVKSLAFQNGKSLTVGSVTDVVSGAAVDGIRTTAGASVLTTAGTSANPNNLTLAKDITNEGIGNVVVGAGVTSAAGVAYTGDVKSTGGKVANTGTTYIYSGKASGTDNLSTVNSSLTSLVVNGLATQNTDTNVAYNASSLGIAGSTASAQVMFREKVTVTNNLSGTTVTGVTYGDAETAHTTAGADALLIKTRSQLKDVNANSGNYETNSGSANNIIISKSVVIDSLTGVLSTVATEYSTSNTLKATATGSSYAYGALTSSKYSGPSIAAGAVRVSVAKKAVTYGGVGVGTKTYDGTDVANLTGTAALSTVAVGSSVSTDGKVLAGDKVALSGTVSGKYDTKNVLGTDANRTNNVTLTGPTLVAGSGGDDTGNYTFSQPAALAGKDTIQAKAVTYGGIGVGTKTYDGTDVANLTGTAALSTVAVGSSVSTDGKVLAGDKVALSGTVSGKYDTKNVLGTDANRTNNVTLTGPTLVAGSGGDDTGNYTFSQPAALAGKDTIQAKAVTYGGIGVGTKTYDGTDVANLTGTAALSTVAVGSSVSTDGKVLAGDKVALSGTVSGKYDTKNVLGTDANRTNNVTLTGPTLVAGSGGDDTGNYTFSQPAALAGKDTIQAKAVTYGGIGVGTKTYDGTDVANLTGTAALSTVAVGSSVSTDGKVLAGDKVALSGTVSGKYDTKNVLGTDANRTNNVTLTGPTLVAGSGGDDTGNYTFSQPAALAGKDTIQAKAVTYGGIGVGTKTYDGTDVANLTGTAALSTVAVGSSVSTDGKVLAGDKVALSGTVSGKYDTKNVLGTDANRTNNVTLTGPTLVAGSGGDDTGNYTFSQPAALAGKDTIQAKAVTYGGIGVGTKTYDGTDVANLTGTAALSTVAVGSSVSTDGKVLAGDKVALSGTVSGKYDTKNVLGTDANRTNNVTLTGPTLVAGSGGDDTGNYTFSQPAALAGKDTILARPVNIAVGTVADKTADGTTSATVTPGALGNLVQGESLTVLVAGANFSDANAGSGKVVTASYTLQDTASGLASNYVLNAGSPNPDSRLRGNILRSVNPVNPIVSPVNNNGSSRVSTVAGSGASGAATGVLDDQPVNQAPQACSDLTPENCECQPSAVASIEICFAPKSVAVIKE